MREYIIALLVIVLALTLVFGAACDGGDDGGEGDKASLDIMKKIPDGIGNFILIDIGVFQNLRNWGDFLTEVGGPFDELGIDTNKLERLAMFKEIDNDEELAVILQGDIDLDNVRDELRVNNFGEEDKYRGIEVWIDAFDDEWTALMRDCIIGGDSATVKRCIKVIESNEASFYDDPLYRGIIDRLPVGFFMSFEGPEAGDGEGILSTGASLLLKDENTLKMVMAVMYENENAAAKAESEFKEDTFLDSTIEVQHLESSQDMEFWTITYEVDISDFDKIFND
ncbi:MAG: hypothetical protein GY861_15325 [bacterium]|nr:hypothetical protein [bacterium]